MEAEDEGRRRDSEDSSMIEVEDEGFDTTVIRRKKMMDFSLVVVLAGGTSELCFFYNLLQEIGLSKGNIRPLRKTMVLMF